MASTDSTARYDTITYEVERGRARITLDRPEKHNAINAAMQRELHDAFWAADEDNAVHSVILRGAGRSFCSGFDLSGFRPPTDPGTEASTAASAAAPRPRRGARHIDDDAWHLERSQRLLIAPFDMHKPVVAQVHGHCLAGGTVLALFCDLVIVADDARIGFPPARDLGALPSNLWLYHVGPQWAKRLTLTGDTITGAEAAQLGWALKAVPRAELEAEVEQLCDRFAQIDHHLLSSNKRVVNLGMELMGARTLQRLAAEMDARAHNAPGTAAWAERTAQGGLSDAFRARDAAFGDGRARVNGPERRDERGFLLED